MRLDLPGFSSAPRPRSYERGVPPCDLLPSRREDSENMWRNSTWACASTVLLACILTLPAGAARADRTIEYNRDIRPILAENCFQCHGPDSASRKAELRLDKREAAVDKKAIVPGNLEESELIRRILSEDPEEVMPPPATKKELTREHKELLRLWVTQGAE